MLVHLNVWNARVRDFPSRPIYGVGERSGIKIRSVVPRISWLLWKGFFWRMREKYVIRDFHPLVFFYFLGVLMTTVGLALGIFETVRRGSAATRSRRRRSCSSRCCSSPGASSRCSRCGSTWSRTRTCADQQAQRIRSVGRTLSVPSRVATSSSRATGSYPSTVPSTPWPAGTTANPVSTGRPVAPHDAVERLPRSAAPRSRG